MHILSAKSPTFNINDKKNIQRSQPRGFFFRYLCVLHILSRKNESFGDFMCIYNGISPVCRFALDIAAMFSVQISFILSLLCSFFFQIVIFIIVSSQRSFQWQIAFSLSSLNVCPTFSLFRCSCVSSSPPAKLVSYSNYEHFCLLLFSSSDSIIGNR